MCTFFVGYFEDSRDPGFLIQKGGEIARFWLRYVYFWDTCLYLAFDYLPFHKLRYVTSKPFHFRSLATTHQARYNKLFPEVTHGLYLHALTLSEVWKAILCSMEPLNGLCFRVIAPRPPWCQNRYRLSDIAGGYPKKPGKCQLKI
uniref:Uncharacterized protein n=1 Tax=Ixodes ricinus TaxID=34613 RepID=A0A6B0UU71_IXORI